MGLWARLPALGRHAAASGYWREPIRRFMEWGMERPDIGRRICLWQIAVRQWRICQRQIAMPRPKRRIWRMEEIWDRR